MSCCVYMISDNNGNIKIGVAAKGAEKRLSALQVGNPGKLTLVKTFPVLDKDNAYKLESKFHEYFASFRKSGEWFHEKPVHKWLEENSRNYEDFIFEKFHVVVCMAGDSLKYEDVQGDIKNYCINMLSTEDTMYTIYRRDYNFAYNALQRHKERLQDEPLLQLCKHEGITGYLGNLFVSDVCLPEATQEQRRCKYYLIANEYIEKEDQFSRKYFLATKFTELVREMGCHIPEDAVKNTKRNLSNLHQELEEYLRKASAYYKKQNSIEAPFAHDYTNIPTGTNNMSKNGCYYMIELLNEVVVYMKGKGYIFEITGTGSVGKMVFHQKNQGIMVSFGIKESYDSVRFVPSKEQKEYIKKKKNEVKIPKTVRKYKGTLNVFFAAHNKKLKLSIEEDVKSQAQFLIEKINEVIELEKEAVKKKSLREEEERKREEEAAARQERIKEEYEEIVSLYEDAILYEMACKIRRFINQLPEDDYKLWAEKKADWLDPLIEGDDDLLEQSHKEKIIEKFFEHENVNLSGMPSLHGRPRW